MIGHGRGGEQVGCTVRPETPISCEERLVGVAAAADNVTAHTFQNGTSLRIGHSVPVVIAGAQGSLLFNEGLRKTDRLVVRKIAVLFDPDANRVDIRIVLDQLKKVVDGVVGDPDWVGVRVARGQSSAIGF